MNHNSSKKKLVIAALSLGVVSAGVWGLMSSYNSISQPDLAGFRDSIDHEKRLSQDSVAGSFVLNGDRLGQNENDFRSDLRNLVEWDEQDFRQIEVSIVEPFIEAIEKREAENLRALATDDFSISGLSGLMQERSLRKIENDIHEYDWINSSKRTGAESLGESFNQYLSEFKGQVNADFIGREVKSSIEARGDHMAMSKAEVLFKFDVRGVTDKGELRHDRADIVASVKKEGESWKLKGLEVLSGETLYKKQPQFVSQTHNVGLQDIPSYLRKEAIRRGGYSLSLTDIDQDGHVDMFVGGMGNTQVLKGNGEGHFEKVLTGLEELTLVKSAVFADFKNSGKQDLMVVRFEPSKFQNGFENEEVLLYENKDDFQFERNLAAFSDSLDTSEYDHAMPAAVADFNNDSFLDLYVGFPGNKDFTFLGTRNINSRSEKRVQGLFFNDGQNKFQDHLANSKESDFSVYNDGAGSVVFPHSALAADFNRNGLMDILVIDDVGNLSPMYRNRGGGRFDQNAEAIGLSNSQYGMSTSIGDFDNDGVFDVVMTNVNFHAMERMQKSAQLNYGVPYTSLGTHGLRLFRGEKKNGEVVYQDITDKAGLDFAGEGLAGVEFVDYDNDGHLDIYVVNGLWSGTSDKKSQDLSSLFARAGSHAVNFIKSIAYHDESKQKTSSYLMNILQNFVGDAWETKEQTDGERPSLAGHQYNRLYRNNGDGTFTDVAELEGVASRADGYIVGLADVNLNGHMDLVLRNGDPGSKDVQYSPVEVYLNQGQESHQSVILSFEGRAGNKDAIGVVVEADVGDKTLTRQLVANNGTAQSQKIIHLGLGNNESVDELRIYWPMGPIQKLKDIPSGHHHLIEPDVESPRSHAMR